MFVRIQKLLCLFVLMAFSHITYANPPQPVTNYADLLNSMSQGNTIRAIMFVKKCTPSIADDAIGGMNFTNFNKYQIVEDNQKKDVIATSMTMLVNHPQLGAIYSYVRLRIFTDNSAEIFSQFLDPATYKARLQTRHCN